MSVAIKSLVAVGSLGTLTGAGFAIKHFVSGESIKEHLLNSKEYKNRVFLNSGLQGLKDILDTYHSSKRTKPNDEKGVPLAKEKLVDWCNGAIGGKYSGKNNDFDAIVSWCYINVNTFEKELGDSTKKRITEAQSTNKDWVDAWKKYSKDKETSNLKITGHERDSALNGNKDTDGQAALKAWCDEKAILKMYIDTAKEDFARFEHWCTK
ncbi:hypothetical protein A6V39_04445 [Candidatus Mycoplasma haematobovis]|uniref:Uncharacterized protein n=1 Tax=Candidatus Mycoplasma haematobovis TaxID=432608 RepID=A0A1A9QDH3_9MOLU|nr:hypothetical protein [Candidatus Mycoplasma haematobovis]OAL10134.1 hypothetical protein A6V39_04445 [Candidatus Mycoplasma haematobovis]